MKEWDEAWKRMEQARETKERAEKLVEEARDTLVQANERIITARTIMVEAKEEMRKAKLFFMCACGITIGNILLLVLTAIFRSG